MIKISKFGQKITATSGIGRLMDDLGDALTDGGHTLMLGGGNPAHIPEVQQYFHQSMVELLENKDEFERVIGNYDPPQGSMRFIEAVSILLNNEFGWNIQSKNIALTNGSQSAFFILFNLFAGSFEDGASRKILFPLAPEYIGYSDVGLVEDLFTANKPQIQHIDEHLFKYHIDFDRFKITEEIGAVCVSRPTNPTGNVLTDSEIEKLSDIACANNVPLIIDNAYGTPFPNIIFTDARPIWNENIILCMSLSKLGLPAARTGIVIADEEIIKMVSHINAIINLAPGGLGAAIVTSLVRSGEIIRLSREIIKPFYQAKANEAVTQLTDQLDGYDFHIHKPEGAFFLWLWLRNLPITDDELYQRLKKRGVLVVPGHYFFPGLEEKWRHKQECIRINYAQDKETVRKGIDIIADEVKTIYKSF
jgi:valine--pyruvate aminotransferase